MKFSSNKNINLMGLGFLLIFLGYASVQQYIVLYFSSIGFVDVGFQSLILIYMFFALSNPPAAIFVSKYGAKRSMIISSVFYSIFILTLLSGHVILIYIASAFLGIAASLLWTGQSSYLIRASDKKEYGKNSGFFSCLSSLGSASGVFIIGILISIYLFRIPFLLFSIFPIIGALLFFGLKDLRAEKKSDQFRLAKKALTSKTALNLSSIWLVISFVSGLMFGIIPLQIKAVLGVPAVGTLMAIFYILPMLTSYFFGSWSDIKGRKKMIIFSYFLLMLGLVFLYFSSYAVFLVAGIILLALNSAIIGPMTMALVGDVASESNLEFLAALFSTIQKIGVVSALLLSQIFILDSASIYPISIVVVAVSLILLLPLFRLSTEKIREQISREMK